jgi:hypothetical protein
VGPEVIVPVVMFGGGALVGISYSPVGRAFARRIAADKGEQAESAALAEVDALREDVLTLRHEVGDLQERLDFAERLLAQAREKGLLGQGGA